MRLFVNGTLASYPNLQQLAQGGDRRELLQAWISSGENLSAAEATMSLTKSSSLTGTKARKVDSIIARGGGIEDEDAPGVLEETRYWVLSHQTRVDCTATATEQQVRVNMRPSAAAVGAMLTEDEPCQIRATPTAQQASLSGDVLRAHDAYNEALAAAVGPKSAAAKSRQSGKAEKRPISELSFKTPKEKLTRFSRVTVKKDLKDVAGILMDMPSEGTADLIQQLMASQSSLKDLVKRLSGLDTFEQINPICAEIALAADSLRLVKGKAKGLMAELKRR
ncbi:unnamed protein product [Effrenium voratum]|uniref:Uncharacterized protein n=1 Tax=Effrenium voratum TaxID=2562239 RepID=A0AA36NCY2_9DINO|nr:unnamed protein product [Effrenium voratum]CAJ1407840.1 unnamed protein product [Effrenium voratum]